VKTYFPKTLAEALKIRAETGAVPFAGGTDLMVKRRGGTGVPARFDEPVLFVGGLPELRRIDREGDGAAVLGAGLSLAELLARPETPELLKEALRETAAPAIRNVATLGGNIANASPAGDSLPPLYALEAELLIVSVRGERLIPITDFILGPGRTALAQDELVAEVFIPALPIGAAWYYRKVGTRKAQALAKVSLAALFVSEKAEGFRAPRALGEARLAFGAVGPRVIRDASLEALFRGLSGAGDRHDLEAALDAIHVAAEKAVKPIDDQRSTAAYRRRVAASLAIEAARKAIEVFSC